MSTKKLKRLKNIIGVILGGNVAACLVCEVLALYAAFRLKDMLRCTLNMSSATLNAISVILLADLWDAVKLELKERKFFNIKGVKNNARKHVSKNAKSA